MHTPDTAGLVEVTDVELHYERRGTGPSIVLVHGGTVDGGFYDEIADLLADEFTVVVYDRRGNFRSPVPRNRETSITQQADDLAKLIEASSVQPAVVWASSIGGVIALELLVRRPQLLRGLIVHEPTLFTALDNADDVLQHLITHTAAAIERGGIAGALEEHARQELGDTFDKLSPQRRQRMFDNAEQFFEAELPGFATSMPDAEILATKLKTTRLPVLAVASPSEGPLRQTSQWVADQAGTALRELPGGHLPHIDEPTATAELIRAFTRRALTVRS